LQAAESFILARFHLYSQVYLHKTTRGIEQMLTTFLLRFSEECKKGDKAALVVPPDHPLRVFYADSIPSLNNYIALDDAVIWTVLESSAIKGTGEIRDLAERICSRKILKSVSINVVNPQSVDVARRQYIDQNMNSKIGQDIFEDRASLSIYKDPSKETVKPHKRVYIKREDDSVVDITSLSKPIGALYEDQEVLRYYFINEKEERKFSVPRERSMPDLDDLVVGAVALSGGELVGRIRLQKVMYLLDQLGMKSDARFEYHHYGPYSEAVSDAVTDAKFWGHLKEIVTFRVADGAPYSTFKTDNPPPARLGKMTAEAARSYLGRFSTYSATVLELAATIHWLASKEAVPDWRSEIEIRKAGKTANGRLEQALSLLQAVKLAPA
jgi:uncharacterized protein